jgi:hypothetical protein
MANYKVNMNVIKRQNVNRQGQNVAAKKKFKFKYISNWNNNNNNNDSSNDGIHNGNSDNNTNNNSIIQYRMFQRQSFWCKDVNILTDNISCWCASSRGAIFTNRTDTEHRKVSDVSNSNPKANYFQSRSAKYRITISLSNFFLICIVGGGIKVHSTLRPLNGLLCQPRVIMIMEKSVE